KILKNAVEAIGESGTISVRISLNGRIELAVEDTGSGIDPAVREKLFTPFFSTKEGGQGVGLTLAAEVLRNHGFHYTLESEPGKPTRFLIWF
ncbi:MAG: ATP-binding protein, partial [Gemmatimonadetes bacterium]|nr:ATP-binding protein [Gemmatimonadota bacterium]